MTLIECEYTYAVNYVSLDDGHNITDSYWTDVNKAEKRAKQINGYCNPINLWRDHANNYFKIEYKEVVVDPPTKQEVLNKLTMKERKVLGF